MAQFFLFQDTVHGWESNWEPHSLGIFLHRVKLGQREELKTVDRDQQFSEWEYFQLKHFVSNLPQPIRDDKTLNPIEKLCSIGKPLKHGIALLYGKLTDLETQGTLTCVEKWGHDIGKKLEDSQMIGAVFNFASDITTIEANYKCMVRWHFTPERMSKIHPNNYALCWRECKQVGMTMHVWWDCPRIQEYWEEVLEHGSSNFVPPGVQELQFPSCSVMSVNVRVLQCLMGFVVP